MKKESIPPPPPCSAAPHKRDAYPYLQVRLALARAGRGGSPDYIISKLLMNSLYGDWRCYHILENKNFI